MGVSDRNSSPNCDWSNSINLFTYSFDEIYKSVVDASIEFNRMAAENPYILFPLFNLGIETFSQFVKTQAQIWYDTQNEIYKTNRPYFYNPYLLPNYMMPTKPE
jgi:hypothetical protein